MFKKMKKRIESHAERMEAHYRKAVELHPLFCPSGRTMPSNHPDVIRKTLETVRNKNDRYPRLVNARSFLTEELL